MMRRPNRLFSVLLVLLLLVSMTLGLGTAALAAVDVGGATDEFPEEEPTPSPDPSPDPSPEPSPDPPVQTYYDVHLAETEGGSVSSSHSSAPAGQLVTITAVPDAGYVVDSITIVREDNGRTVSFTALSGNRYRFSMPTSDVTVTVQFLLSTDPEDTGVADWLNTKDHIKFVQGYPEGDFRPEGDMTRAEAAQLFYNLLLDKDVEITTSFDDVADSNWFATAVNTLASLGKIGARSGNNFCPNEPITRAEFIALAMSFAHNVEGAVADFTDVEESDWYYEAVASGVAYGWISGYPDGSFRPDASMSRAEVMVLANRMLGRVADKAYIDAHVDELVQFSDMTSAHWAYYHVAEAANGHDYEKTSSGETWTALH